MFVILNEVKLKSNNFIVVQHSHISLHFKNEAWYYNTVFSETFYFSCYRYLYKILLIKLQRPNWSIQVQNCYHNQTYLFNISTVGSYRLHNYILFENFQSICLHGYIWNIAKCYCIEFGLKSRAALWNCRRTYVFYGSGLICNCVRTVNSF